METDTHPVQTAIYQKMTPQQKYDVMCSLIDTARLMKKSYLRSLHPEWTEAEINAAVRDWLLYARG
jgi:hypothetical protein